MVSMSSSEKSSTDSDLESHGCGGEIGVGLSNPQLSQGRRRMLDLINRLHSTGYATESPYHFGSMFNLDGIVCKSTSTCP
jgi:hypothetical protein